MFGFGKKKAPEPPARSSKRDQDSKDRKAQNVAQLGFLVGVEDDVDLDADDADLEDELMMLLNGEDISIRGRPKPPSAPSRQRAPPPIPSRPKTSRPSNVNLENLNANFEDEEDGEDSDIDLDDPELAAELGELTGETIAVTPECEEEEENEAPPPPVPSKSKEEIMKILVERLDLYEKAKAIADSNGDSGKSRRFTRSIKTLKEQVAKAKSGKVIDESEIPPPVSLGSVVSKQLPDPPISASNSIIEPDNSLLNPVIKTPPRPFTPEPDYNTSMNLPEPLIPVPVYVPSKVDVPVDPVVEAHIPVTPVPAPVVDPEIEMRLKDYKRVAVVLKRSGDTQGAVQYLKLSKTLESAIKNGEPIDLSSYPAIPSAASSETVAPVIAPNTDPPAEPVPTPAFPDEQQQPQPSEDIFGAPPPPKTIMEALEQRLEKYKSEVEKANSTSNASKARRIGRIVKQYEEAINFYKKGKPVAYDELPTPPGFAPIPHGAPPAPPTVAPQPAPVLPAASDLPPERKISAASLPNVEPSSSPGSGKTSSSPGPASSIQRGGKPVTKLTHQEKQLALIMLRQKQFREAAINAKKRGDIDQAREFLRTAKGFDKLISHSQAGLPVDMATLPAPPEAVLELEDTDFEVVSQADCIQITGSAAEVYAKLEEDLKAQMKMCMRTRDHFKSIGDIGSANRFESMALESKRDLDTLRLAARTGSDLPKHHYENRIFSITECNTDINEDEIEISVLQGVNYKVSNPSDVDTYVRVELPYPSVEEAQSNKTQIIKDTNNPNYNATFKMTINRTARNFQRFVHRHGVKFEVYSKGGLCSGGIFFCHRGFLRSNTLIGQATAKLLPLETKCTLHDGFDILDGRKVVGKLEAKIRIRDPILTKQITQKKEKWLSIDRV